jgi:CheY-like chemotaxis protein
VVSELPPEQQRMLQKARFRDAVLEGRRILIVEDDVRNVYSLSSVLEPRGAKIAIARNGREAIEALDASAANLADAIDLVLMDVMMPVMDGLSAAREIRGDPRWKNLPIVMLTAKAMPDDQERCLAAGANDYMAKPIDVDKLLSSCACGCPGDPMTAGDDIEDIEIQLFLEALHRRYHYDFRHYAQASIKRRLVQARVQLGYTSLSAIQEAVLHDESAAAPAQLPDRAGQRNVPRPILFSRTATRSCHTSPPILRSRSGWRGAAAARSSIRWPSSSARRGWTTAPCSMRPTSTPMPSTLRRRRFTHSTR